MSAMNLSSGGQLCSSKNSRKQKLRALLGRNSKVTSKAGGKKSRAELEARFLRIDGSGPRGAKLTQGNEGGCHHFLG